MGEQHSVQVEPVPLANQAPTPDSELRDATQEVAQEATPEVASESARPEWLPEKFESPQDLASAYSELETKLSSDDSPPAFEEFQKEFDSEGSLGDGSYKKLDALGVPREMVDAYIAGVEATRDSETTAVYDMVGGKDSYEKIGAWVGANLPEGEVNTLNDMLVKGGESAKMATQLMQSRYESVHGKEASLVQANAASTSRASFASYHELMQAMGDPRYSKDPVYQKQVSDRLSISKDLI